MDYLLSSTIIGIGATAVMDLWGLARKPLLGVPVPDYAPLGRWLALMPRGQFWHASIARVASVKGERVIGWTAHYLVGISFAALLLLLKGQFWLSQPALGPALTVGVATVCAPFLLMQPAFGAGIAASRTPRPNAARLQSVITHAVFGVGLYAAAQALNLLLPGWIQAITF